MCTVHSKSMDMVMNYMVKHMCGKESAHQNKLFEPLFVHMMADLIVLSTLSSLGNKLKDGRCSSLALNSIEKQERPLGQRKTPPPTNSLL